VFLLAAFLLLTTTPLPAYSVLTHEQIVDFLWQSDIVKLLRERYPNITPEQLREAHAYAYGGCLIQDMGYYPGGNKFFSDLVHYVRSGDFVIEMVRQAQSVDEFAFALGALAHYVSDTNGHPTVNRSVPREFPKLRRKYGNVITYEDDPASHIQTEFGFDVLEVAKQRYTSQSYHDFIGFEVAQSLLDRAFLATYGLELKSVLKDEDRAIGSFRHAISVWLPRLTQAALITKKDELQAIPNFNAKAFRYTLSRAQYEKEWGRNYYHPGFWAKVIAVVVKILPKVGPLRVIDPRPPTAETERMYLASVQKTVTAYHNALLMTKRDDFSLPNDDLDTGDLTKPGEYKLADRAYARLVKELTGTDFVHVQPDLKQNILSFYSDLRQPFETRRHNGEWVHLLADLYQLNLVKHATAQKAAVR